MLAETSTHRREFVEENNKWSNEKGIKFSSVTTDDVEDLKVFMREHFYCEEPICRSIEVAKGDTWYDKWMFNLCQEVLLLDPIQKSNPTGNNSIIARNIADNSVAGCYIGVVYNNGFKFEGISSKLIAKLPSCLPLPQKLRDVINVHKLLVDLCYGEREAFDELDDSGGYIHFLASLTVSKEARRKGLGTELVKRGHDIANKSGCRYTYMLATSKYLQRILEKLSNTIILHDADYDDYEYDSQGTPFLLDNRDHKLLQVVVIDRDKKICVKR